MDRLLYNCPIPEDAQITTQGTLSQQISARGAVGRGESAVSSISLDPGQQRIQGSYRDPNLGGLLAQQFEELFDAGGIDAVPYFGVDGHDSVDGYYTLDSTDVGPADPSTHAIQTYDGTVTKKGTKKSHLRAVRVAPSAVDTVGASNYTAGDPPPSTERVYLPSDARRTRWFDPVGGTVEHATPLNKWQFPATTGEFAGYRAYDCTDASFYGPSDRSTPPALVYALPYGREYQTDVRVWDTAPGYVGAEKVIEGDLPAGSHVGGPGATVGAASVGASAREDNVAVASTWQSVFSSDHEFRGECVLDNRVLRLRFDDERGAIHAQRSRGGFDDWSDQPLRPSPWAVADVDLTHVGLARVEAQVDFESPAGERYTVDVALPRGFERAVWTVAQNQHGAAPPALAQKLAPIAMYGGVTVRVANQRADLVAREEVRR